MLVCCYRQKLIIGRRQHSYSHKLGRLPYSVVEHLFILSIILHHFSWNSYWLRWISRYHDVSMDAMVTQITSLTSSYSIVYPGADQRKHQSSESLAFLHGIHRWPVDSPHKRPVTRKMLLFDDVIMNMFWVVSGWIASQSRARWEPGW